MPDLSGPFFCPSVVILGRHPFFTLSFVDLELKGLDTGIPYQPGRIPFKSNKTWLAEVSAFFCPLSFVLVIMLVILSFISQVL